MTRGFSKLYSCIVTSSLWIQPDYVLRVWIALLATSDAVGHVEGSIPGFASLCRISLEDMAEAERLLMAPDPYSRSSACEGRRIERVPGGWRIINYEDYRKRGQDKAGSRAADMRRFRARKCNALHAGVTGDPEAKADLKRKSQPLPGESRFERAVAAGDEQAADRVLEDHEL